MSRIDERFRRLRTNGRKALITFVTAGDPDIDTTSRLVLEMEKQGADIIELGVPYSDPVAEGPVIQAANKRALEHGIRIKDIMGLAGELRCRTQIPLIYLLYYNCILQYGPGRFFKDCSTSGVDGVIIPDLPFEEKGEIDDIASAFNVNIITLVAPTSKERIEAAAKNASGFLYCVSSLGVTGVRKDFSTDFEEFFGYVNRYCSIPTALGFGISTPEHIRRLKGYSDGLIVGSAIVREIEASSSREEAVERVGRLTGSLRRVMDE